MYIFVATYPLGIHAIDQGGEGFSDVICNPRPRGPPRSGPVPYLFIFGGPSDRSPPALVDVRGVKLQSCHLINKIDGLVVRRRLDVLYPHG